jgi:diaminopimelate epimerase
MSPPEFERKGIPATGDGDYWERIGPFDVYAVNTGVPHAVIFVDDVDSIDIVQAAPPVRHHTSFPHGANVNFVQKTGDNSIRIRTFERGVEDETLSCGTGATASALIAHKLGYTGNVVNVETSGGPLVISIREHVCMEGPAVTVFTGVISY